MLDNNKQLNEILTTLPNRPYCTDNLACGLQIRPLEIARTRQYLQINPPCQQHYLVFDIDRPNAAFAWENCAAAPNYAAINPKNGHAHLVYKLAEPVATSENGKLKPLRYLAAVERAYRVALGADAGYSGLITRNPYKTRTMCLHAHEYDLFELTDWLKHDLGHYVERKTPTAGLGRNVTLFDTVRVWAYKAIRFYRVAARSRLFDVWHNEVLERSLAVNGEFLTPLAYSEVKATAKSIAKYCWRKDTDAERRFSLKQAQRGAQGGKASGVARAKVNEDKRVQARLLAAKGVSKAAIARELGVHRNSITNWLK